MMRLSIMRMLRHRRRPHSIPLHSAGADSWSRPLSRGKAEADSSRRDVSRLFVPLAVPKLSSDDGTGDASVGVELAGKLTKIQIGRVFNSLYRTPNMRIVAREHGLDRYLFHQAFVSFRRFCLESSHLPPDLHITLYDIIHGSTHSDSLLPFFLQHARSVFPHLECMDDLKKISDLREPAQSYPEARALARRIVFHGGPTNSGKTHNALERFMQAKSGVYCGPLKMLAVEVFEKCRARGVPCDLITGEERRLAREDGEPSPLVACTVEMVSVNTRYDVAVIDEIQMLRELHRGWAWTRALLGVAADEVHVCGEQAAWPLVNSMATSCGDEVEERRYQRLCPLRLQDSALFSLENLQPGDCVVCFSKSEIYSVSQKVEKMGITCAVIYGSLPPGTKLAQARRFNDPDDPCTILVATDAIGMGINLNIRRVIFNSLTKPSMNDRGEKVKDLISCSQALQIAGRAGRYKSSWDQGLVTTMRPDDLPILRSLLEQTPEDIPAAGIYPTVDQIELYGYHLPEATLSNLVDIFKSLCVLDDSLYFMCFIDNFKTLASKIENVPLPLRVRYIFCCAPIDCKQLFLCNMFLRIARQFSTGGLITIDWLCERVGWPVSSANSLLDLVKLEQVFDVFDMYLWLSYRFPHQFAHHESVRRLQTQLDELICQGVANIVRLLRTGQDNAEDSKSQSGSSRLISSTENDVNTDEFVPVGGSLTKRLLSDGLLTKKMMDDLRGEWSRSLKRSNRSHRKKAR